MSAQPVPVAGTGEAPQTEAICRLRNNYGMDVERFCRHQEDESGAITLSLPGDEPIADNILVVSLQPMGEDQMEVRGLTTDGLNSRWGRAQPSAEDRDCWQGADFTVCIRARR